MSDAKPPAIDAQLAARTAEALALPQLVCRSRACRRQNRCLWFFRSSGERCCMRNLTAEQRRVFDVVYHDADVAWHWLGTDPHWFAAREGEGRTRDDLGIAIARAHTHRWWREKWDAERRAREKRLAQFDKEQASGKDGSEGRRG